VALLFLRRSSKRNPRLGDSSRSFHYDWADPEMRTVHIVPGDSAAGSLRQALGVSGEHEVVGLRDTLSCGPLPITSSLEQWARVRHEFWQGVHPPQEDAARSDLLPDVGLLKEADLITLWLGNGLGDQITLPWLCWLLRLSGIDESRLRVVQFPGDFVERHATPSLGFLTPQQILKPPLRPRFQSMTW